jgi:hypothetical protein
VDDVEPFLSARRVTAAAKRRASDGASCRGTHRDLPAEPAADRADGLAGRHEMDPIEDVLERHPVLREASRIGRG